MTLADLVLLAANAVYATSYVATRVTLGSVPPATLAFARLVIGALILAPLIRPRGSEPPCSRDDRRAIAGGSAAGRRRPRLRVLLAPGAARAPAPSRGRRHRPVARLGRRGDPARRGGRVASGSRPVWTGPAVAGTLYLAVVITGLGYVAWNWALARVSAPRAALFLNLQPIVGALLGAALLGEPLSGFTIAGGAAIVAGLAVAFGSKPR